MKKKNAFIISTLAMLAVSVVPAAMALAASPKAVTDTHFAAHQGATTTMTAVKPAKKGEIVPNTMTSTFNAGSATLSCYNVGGGDMDADWTLRATNGLITSVQVQVEFDDGAVSTQKGATTPSSTQYGSAQWNVGGPAYHSATLSGTCWVDFGIFINTIVPTTDGCFVSA